MEKLRHALAGLYDIEAPLGRGGMALVYLARERRLDRRVALKVLLPDLAADETCRLRFLSEARTIARLTHPNIVPIFTVDEIGGFVFFAMAYVPGETLSHRVASQGPVDPQQAGRLICGIGEALDYAHARGVVHRDVKPDNILLDAFADHALLSDFGIAHSNLARIPYGLRGRPAAPRGHVVGTAAFMSPEQASGDVVDARSDIYSLGVVAYYMLSGQLPFDALTDEALLALHVNAPPPPLSTVARSVPPRLAQIVDRCLAKAPWERFPDAAALVKEVAEAVGARPVPLAVRAFLIRSTHLEAPALIHAAFTGVGLMPATVAAWSSPTSGMVRGSVTVVLAAALALPAVVQIVRVRRLLAAGHRREELVAALAARQARRREELAFVYGAGPTSFERSLAWLARVSLLVAIAAGLGAVGAFPAPDALVPLLSPIAAAAVVTALLASIVARARTEQRTDPIGERTLRFWRGPLGRALFRVAGPRFGPVAPVVRILDRLETPA
ncbi:MAG TPA: serine/threonine-protein kinase [Gemmatimonadales bacterium]|nr:serine/threonine-protein kinase [Gemmatimonadales bacterium]